MASDSIASDTDWKAESDLRTLADAEEIKSDPKRYKAALAMAKQKIEALQDLQDDADEEKTSDKDD